MLRCHSLRVLSVATRSLTALRHCSSPASSVKKQKIQIAVVGSGPSGCFVASALTKKNPDIHVDIFEKLPVPFGLCRYGVSPDHPDVKNVEKQFMELFKSNRVTWIGNVNIGREVPLDALLTHYACVVFATGVTASATLNVPGSDLVGVLRASDVVYSYNTVPFPYGSPRLSPIPFDQVRRAVLVGNGNVSVDVARFLASHYHYFAPTDMNCHVVKALMENQIHSVEVLGRSGVERSAFSTASFRELTEYDKGRVRVLVDSFSLEDAIKRKPATTNTRAHTRMMELLHKFQADASEYALPAVESVNMDEPDPAATRQVLEKLVAADVAVQKKPSAVRGPCSIHFRYHTKVVRFLPSPSHPGRLGGILVKRTDPDEATSSYAVVPCDVAIQSIGSYSDIGESVSHLPTEAVTGRIIHHDGRVEGIPRVYCAGWAKNGSKGVIMHSLSDAQETARHILEDIAKNVIPSVGKEPEKVTDLKVDEEVTIVAQPAAPSHEPHTTTMQGKFGLIDYFVAKKLQPVSVAGLERIFYVEKNRGIDLGKRLEKMSSVREMLDVALGGDVGKSTAEEVRGITPARPKPLLYLKELLDDETDLSPFAHSLAKDLPGRLAAKHPNGPLNPSQL